MLANHGFERIRQRGSHIVMQRHSDDGTTTVPVPDHKELKTGTLLLIIRQSGVPRSEFEG
ncbi:MAG: type II toxin-antitoxin system HicA family toxin [Methanobacteriota archaeon]|nr:MAG: type II toxin-antitoxin system HicA family toxin [Euryarchaeota archaeon]